MKPHKKLLKSLTRAIVVALALLAVSVQAQEVPPGDCEREIPIPPVIL